jgi:hypothetical protein
MFRNALAKYADTWRLVQREASGSMQAHVDSGSLLSKNPLTLSPNWRGKAAVTLMNGVGFVPVIFTGIKNYRDFELRLDDQSLNQEVHGNDFWQTDYDEVKREWRVTCNIPRDGRGINRLELRRANNSRFGK